MLSKAYTTKKVDDNREQITIINDEALTPEEYSAIKDIQFNLQNENISFDLAYEVMARACDILAEIYNDEQQERFDRIKEQIKLIKKIRRVELEMFAIEIVRVGIKSFNNRLELWNKAHLIDFQDDDIVWLGDE